MADRFGCAPIAATRRSPATAHAATKQTGGGASKKSAAAARNGKRAAAQLALSLPAGGFGVAASVTEEGFLQLTQANEGAEPDNICLTRYEAKALFDKFGEWIVEA